MLLLLQRIEGCSADACAVLEICDSEKSDDSDDSGPVLPSLQAVLSMEVLGGEHLLLLTSSLVISGYSRPLLNEMSD